MTERRDRWEGFRRRKWCDPEARGDADVARRKKNVAVRPLDTQAAYTYAHHAIEGCDLVGLRAVRLT